MDKLPAYYLSIDCICIASLSKIGSGRALHMSYFHLAEVGSVFNSAHVRESNDPETHFLPVLSPLCICVPHEK